MEIVARSETFDGVRLLFWEDGMIVTGLGYGVGRGTGRARTPETMDIVRRANWLVSGECCLYTLSEIAVISQVARKYVADCMNKKTHPLPGDYRKLIAKRLPPI